MLFLDSKPSHALPNLDPDADTETATPEDDDAALMAMMGLGGFGSTKVGTILWTGSWLTVRRGNRLKEIKRGL